MYLESLETTKLKAVSKFFYFETVTQHVVFPVCHLFNDFLNRYHYVLFLQTSYLSYEITTIFQQQKLRIQIMQSIYVINFKEASGRFFFPFLEVFEKCIEYIRIFFIHFLEISKFW